MNLNAASELKSLKYAAIANRILGQMINGVTPDQADKLAKAYNAAQWHSERVKYNGFTYRWECRRSDREGGYYVGIFK